MNPTQLTKKLIELAGPLGPLGTEEARERLRSELIQGEPVTIATAILDAVSACPELPVTVAREDFEFTASELLAEIGDSPKVAAALTQRLAQPGLRVVILDALALLAARSAAPALAALARAQVPHASLNPRELVRLASALGSVGGAEALAAVELLRAHGGWPPEVVRELEIALESLGDSTSAGR